MDELELQQYERALDLEVKAQYEMLSSKRLTKHQLISLSALFLTVLNEQQKLIEELIAEHEETVQLVAEQATSQLSATAFFKHSLDELDIQAKSSILSALVTGIVKGEKSRATKMGKAGADAQHGKAGGSREKQAAIRAIWASGKYANRDLCAEQECGALCMSYSAARKALRNTPEPDRT